MQQQEPEKNTWLSGGGQRRRPSSNCCCPSWLHATCHTLPAACCLPRTLSRPYKLLPHWPPIKTNEKLCNKKLTLPACTPPTRPTPPAARSRAVQPIEHLPHVAAWQAFEYVGCGAALKSNNGNYANCKWSSSSSRSNSNND